MPSRMSLPAFTADQRKRLLALGLLQSQIDELEAVLPLAAAFIQAPPALADVRDCLVRISGAQKRASKELLRLLDVAPTLPALLEAQYRVLAADSLASNRDPGETVRVANYALFAAGAVFQRALDDLPPPPTQRRHRAASAIPIFQLDAAMLRGFIKSHGETARPMPLYAPKRSASPGSQYRRIVGICYEAMGQRNTDPERAIKAFIRERGNLFKASPHLY
jgi:hypothetical protein